jgi:hypothetical protein
VLPHRLGRFAIHLMCSAVTATGATALAVLASRHSGDEGIVCLEDGKCLWGKLKFPEDLPTAQRWTVVR